jgi:DNA-binding CsgD family transcriptional regulator
MSDELLGNPIASFFDRRLRLLQELTGVPVVGGGVSDASSTGSGKSAHQLTMSHLRGTITDCLSGLVVTAGYGLGGLALACVRACVVNDYASSRAITHHYDRQVVEGEKITSAFAVPVLAGGHVAGVLYGGYRDARCIGDVIVRRAEGVAYKLGQDIARPERTPKLSPGVQQAARNDALTDILAVAQHVSDPDLRARLERAHRTLAGNGTPARVSEGSVVLAPRELDSLRLAAVGASNAEIAADLGLSATTVKAYLRNAMRKLHVHNRTAATHAARRAGLI